MQTTVDIGNNLASLISQLAAQIGTTTDKVFPWYVQQQLIEGWVFLCMMGALLVISLILLAGIGKVDSHSGKGMPRVIVGGLVGGFVFMACIANLNTAVAQVLNPQYGAMKAMARDIGQMRGR